MISNESIIKHEVSTYAELLGRRDIPDKTLVLVNDSLDDPSNTNKVKKGLYIFCSDCKKICRVTDIHECTLDEEYKDILKEYFKPQYEHQLIRELFKFKDKIYKQAPESSVDYRSWIDKLTENWMDYVNDIAKEQKKDPMDLNVDFRVQVCLIFLMTVKTNKNSEDFNENIYFHLACQLIK